MTITRRLLLTLSITLLALLFVGGYGLWTLEQSEQRFQAMQEKILPSIKTLRDARAALSRSRIASFLHAASFDSERKAVYMKDIDTSDGEIDRQFAAYGKELADNEADRRLLAADLSALSTYRQELKAMLEKSNNNDTSGARDMLQGSLANQAKALEGALAAHIDYNNKIAKQLNTDNAAAFQLARGTLLAVVVVALLVSSILALLLYRAIRGGLASIQQTLEHVSRSLDFTQRAPVVRNDEIGRTAHAFNELLERLQSNLKTLLHGAREVAQASRQMAEAAEQVSSAADVQSQASSSVASTVQQMAVSIDQVSGSAEQAYGLARESGEQAESGSTTISQTINDIRDISKAVGSAAKSVAELEQYHANVSQVIQVIHDIADQTNLLALNAAIEAARAGEQGRGFAVVADEVRKLAERTSASTQEISEMIAAMREHSGQVIARMQTAEQLVGNGVSRADDADQAIKRIGSSSLSTAEVVSQISHAIREQSSASSSIGQQIERITQMAAEASAAVRQTADGARRLDQLAASQTATLGHYVL
jgi:methyl-accepting chemotaxis protein